MPERIVLEHFRSIRRQLLETRRQTSATLTHHGTQGQVRESFIQQFLSDNLPSLHDPVSGQLFDHMDTRSCQVDTILLSSWSPRLHLTNDVKMVPVDSTLGCIEVKTHLTTASLRGHSELRKALLDCYTVKALVRQSQFVGTLALGTTFNGTKKRTPYFLVAYEGPAYSTLCRIIAEFSSNEHIQAILKTRLSYQGGDLISEDYTPEVICVLDPPYCVVQDDGILTKKQNGAPLYFEGEDGLAVLFAYLTNLISLWNQSPPPCNFNAYLR